MYLAPALCRDPKSPQMMRRPRREGVEFFHFLRRRRNGGLDTQPREICEAVAADCERGKSTVPARVDVRRAHPGGRCGRSNG